MVKIIKESQEKCCQVCSLILYCATERWPFLTSHDNIQLVSVFQVYQLLIDGIHFSFFLQYTTLRIISHMTKCT